MALKYMLLALIQLQPRTGYQLTKVFDHVLSNFWSADQRQVYHALDKMESDGWIIAERVVQENAPNKKVYSITQEGLAELRKWLGSPQPPPPVRLDWMAQVFFGGLVEPEELEPVITARLERLEKRQAEMCGHIADYQRILDNPALLLSGRMFALRMLMFRYVLVQQQTERIWLEDMVTILKELKDEPADDMAAAKRLLQGLLEDFPALHGDQD